MISRIENDINNELYSEYIVTALYTISNYGKMSKTLSEIKQSSKPVEQQKSGKEVAEEVANRIGIKINWGK